MEVTLVSFLERRILANTKSVGERHNFLLTLPLVAGRERTVSLLDVYSRCLRLVQLLELGNNKSVPRSQSYLEVSRDLVLQDDILLELARGLEWVILLVSGARCF